MPAGRPPVWDNPDELEKAIDAYFNEPQTHTWTGLALHLGFESRQSLNNYLDKPEFFYPLKKALTKIEQKYENELFGRNPTGAIFALKNFGWRDKQEVEQSGKTEQELTVKIIDGTGNQGGSTI